MKAILAPAAAAAILAGCSSGSENLEPGQWTMTVEVTEADAPGAPASAQQQLIDELNRELAMDPACFTEEQAAAPTPDMFVFREAVRECDFDGSTIENGTIAIEGTCGESGDGGTLSVNGTYAATSIDATMEARIQDGNEALEFTATMTGERTGDCG